MAVPERSARQVPPGVVVAAGVWVVLVIGIHALNALRAERATMCPFKQVTGVPCATCGGTRATFALGTGRIVEALVLNPLVAFGVPIGIVWLAACVWQRRWVGATVYRRRMFWVVMGAVFAANWVYVIVAGRV